MGETGVKEYPYCFGCGADNPIGLKLAYRVEGEFVVTEFTPQEEHQGWPGVVHGGIITTLLYEVMENFSYQNEVVGMMKSMDTSFRRPGKTGERILAKSWLVEESEREMRVAASLTNEDGKVVAEGSAVVVVLNHQQKDRLGIG